MATLVIFLILLALIAFFLVHVFNRFAKLRNLVKDAWSNIDVALRRRYDLIPNLVETVRGYADHERTTLEAVINARNEALSVPPGDINSQIRAEQRIQRGLKDIFALGEAYPGLKANTNFVNLQQQLGEIEDNLERARRYYNGSVRENNTYGESMPGILVASLFKYQQFEYFQAEDAERGNVKVAF